LVRTDFGPAAVGELIGVMVKSADVMAAPVVVDVVVPVMEVEAAGVGKPVVVFDRPLLLVLAAAATGAPVTTVEGTPLTVLVPAAVFADVLHAVTVENVGPLVLPLKVVVGAPGPTVVTILLYPRTRCRRTVRVPVPEQVNVVCGLVPFPAALKPLGRPVPSDVLTHCAV